MYTLCVFFKNPSNVFDQLASECGSQLLVNKEGVLSKWEYTEDCHLVEIIYNIAKDDKGRR